MHYWETDAVVLLVSEALHWYSKWELMNKWVLFACHEWSTEWPIRLCHCLLGSSCSFLAKLSSNFTVSQFFQFVRGETMEWILTEGNLYTGLFMTEILVTSMHVLLSFEVMNKSIVLHINGILVSKDRIPRQFTHIKMNGTIWQNNSCILIKEPIA